MASVSSRFRCLKPFSWFHESRRGLTSGSKKRVFFGVLYFEDFARVYVGPPLACAPRDV